jgi:predicted anti-sigma-YlaC factor YlaD
LLVGALWILQGVGIAKGSFMTGHATYTVLGAGLVLVGALLLRSAWRHRGEGPDSQ